MASKPTYDELSARVAALERATRPQALRQALEFTWDPRGGEPRIIDEGGNTLDYQGAIQLMGGTATVDPQEHRVIYTPTGGGGGGSRHVILDPLTGSPLPDEPDLLLVSLTPALAITAVDVAGIATVLQLAYTAPATTAVSVFDGGTSAPGTYTYTVPTGALALDVIMVGAGGGGGDGTSGGGGSGGGGGGGGYQRWSMDPTALGASFNVTLGAPGAAGAGGGDGGDATATFINVSSGAETVTARGGTAGAPLGAAGVGGDGARYAGGVQGGDGGNGSATTLLGVPGQAGADGAAGSAGGGAGGQNADSFAAALVLGGSASTVSAAAVSPLGYRGGPGAVSDPSALPASPDGFRYGGGGAGGTCASGAHNPAGAGGPALIVIVAHLP